MTSAHSKNDDFIGDEHLCLATLNDYDAVMAIDRNVYSGLDYLPSSYTAIVQNRGTSAFVYRKGERVVAFITAELVDGGQTLVTSGGRVSEDCRGGGTFSRFKRRVFQQFRGSADLRYAALTVNNVIMATNGPKILKTHRIVEERTITTVLMDVSEAKRQVSNQIADLPCVRQLSKEDVAILLSRNPSDLSHLFPDGRVTLEWKPHRIMAANIESVYGGENSNRLILTSSADFFRTEHSISAEFPGTLLSFGGYHHCSVGVRYHVDLFGNGSDEEMRAHFERHFLRLIENCSGKQAVVQILFSRTLDEVLCGMMDNFCLRASDTAIVKMTVLEAPYTQIAKL